MKRRSEAIWHGAGKEGRGFLTSTSGVLQDTPYSFALRFENEDGKAGTNPEELIAAAHAGCFNMALSIQLVNNGFNPVSLHTEAVVNMEKVDGKMTINQIELNLTGNVPDISPEKFLEIAEGAKSTCPVSRALAAIDITLCVELK